MDNQILGSRIKSAREAVGATQEQIAQDLEIPRSGVSDMEQGKRSVTAAELVALSQFLRQPIAYFVEPSAAPPREPFAVRFRSLELSHGDDDAVFAFEQSCRDYAWLENELEAKFTRQPPLYDWLAPKTAADANEQGEELAKQERRRLELGSDPVHDPFEVVESQGIRVFVIRLETEAISGIFHRDERFGACILVNAAFHPNRRAFDLMHEYGHILTDHGVAIHRTEADRQGKDPIERRADAFAAAFLLPRDGVETFLASRGIRPKKAELALSDVCLLTVMYGASYQATVFRLCELGYLDVRDRERFLALKDITQWMKRFRDASRIESHDFDDPRKRRFGQLALRAFAQDIVSVGRVAELLRIDLDEARAFTKLARKAATLDQELVAP